MNRQWVTGAVLAGLAAWGGWNRWEVVRLGRQVEEWRSAEKVEEPDRSGSDSAERALELNQTELIALRHEIVALRRLVEDRLRLVQPEGVVDAVSSSPRAGGETRAALPSYIRNGWVDRSGIPGVVLDGFRLQLGDVAIEGAHIKQSDGKVFYSMESKTQDGRGMELALDEKGQVVMRRIDMELGGLSEGMQRTVQQAVGEIPIRRVAEVFEDGRTVYRVQAKAPNQAVELVFDSEGKVIRSETMVRETKP